MYFKNYKIVFISYILFLSVIIDNIKPNYYFTIEN